ncbi:hypothetical protein KIK84_07695 [Curvibacter sp. CHRR-16]|uniref:hypothetical protein n=1 Tax=Curvibacter sp. CHRR-16 TaxID=2835872 RepID=UPI001BD95488|nr:hypothetical protein [Curvibacter sp. CHRR-16]MBT0570204.1 hypothetical protein [Curvibacter sp. CHRR-16]
MDADSLGRVAQGSLTVLSHSEPSQHTQACALVLGGSVQTEGPLLLQLQLAHGVQCQWQASNMVLRTAPEARFTESYLC